MLNVDDLFKGRHFDREIIVLCVRWYLRYKLSFRDLVEMMAERGLSLAHTTIMRWIQRYAPEFEKRWNRFARPVGQSWRVDETYVKIKGRWTYLYRAVDKEGKTVDVLLRAKRDVAAAKAFFVRAFRARADCRIRSRSMAIRPLIAPPKRFSASIPREIDARSDPQNI
jgi:transposase-like protein